MSVEVRPGYKQTEVGVIPDQWELKRLGELATIATGNTPPTRDASNYGDEYLFVGPVDMGDEKFISKTEKQLSKKGFAASRRFPKDSILFVSIGSTIGKCGIAPVELTSNQQINAIFPSPSFSVDYLFYAVCAAAPRIKAQAGEQAVPIVNKTQFSDTVVAIPPVAEQRAIAEALSDVDALLGGLDRLIVKKRDLKQAAMQQLLTGQTRLPGFHGEWKDGCLADVIGGLEAGVSVNSTEEYGDAARYENSILKTSAVAAGRFIPHECKRIAARDVARARLNPRRDTLLISRMNTPDLVGECGYVDRDYPNLFVPDRLWLARFRQGTDVSALWLSYLLSTPRLKQWVRAAATGTSGSMKNLSKRAFLEIPTIFPPGREQAAIAGVLSDIDAEVASLEARRTKTRALKQAMMQELLTGKTRLVTPDNNGGSHEERTETQFGPYPLSDRRWTNADPVPV